MANNKLYITISDKRLGDGNGQVPSNSASKSEEKEDTLLKRYAEHELFHFVKSSAMTTINYSVSNIGNMTGDYITQRKVATAKQMVESGVSIGMSTLAGAKVGGPIGAAIGFVVGVGGNAINGYFEDLKNRTENAKTNYNIEQLRDKVGLNTKLDGSRGTEN